MIDEEIQALIAKSEKTMPKGLALNIINQFGDHNAFICSAYTLESGKLARNTNGFNNDVALIDFYKAHKHDLLEFLFLEKGAGSASKTNTYIASIDELKDIPKKDVINSIHNQESINFAKVGSSIVRHVAAWLAAEYVVIDTAMENNAMYAYYSHTL